MIEGDEAEMLTATDAHAVGETLLVREYLLVRDNEAHLPLALTSSAANPHIEDDVMMTSSTPKQSQSVPSVRGSSSDSSQVMAEANSGASVQSLPYSRPVTPQSYSRPHTASKALPQQCKSSGGKFMINFHTEGGYGTIILYIQLCLVHYNPGDQTLSIHSQYETW